MTTGMMQIHPAVKAGFAFCAALSVGGLLGWKHYYNTVVLPGYAQEVREMDLARERVLFTPEKLSGAAPDFTIESLSGGKISLADYKGKVLLLNFWASYCAPCLKELPSMYQLARRHAGDNFAIVAISLDDSWEPVRDLFDRQVGSRPPFAVGIDPTSAIAHQYGTEKIPETYIIGPDGQLLDKFISDRDWSSTAAQEYFARLLRVIAAKPG